MPTVSVVIPTYNSEKFLPETLESILVQDFQDFEILVIDDCSTDNTKDIVQNYPDPRIKYFCLVKNHGGPSRARNIGLQKAQGEFIALCDSDDLFTPGHLSDAVSLLSDRPELGMIFTDEVKFDDETGQDLGNFLKEYNHFHKLPKEKTGDHFHVIQPQDSFPCLFFENYIMPSGIVARGEVFNDVGPFDETLQNGDDRDMWFRITKKYPVGFISKIGFRYRIRSNSVSGRGPGLAENRLRVLYKQLETGLPQLLRKRCRKMIASNYFGIGYHFQKNGQMASARKYYLRSFKTVANFKALKGLVVSFLGGHIYLFLRKLLKGTGVE